MKVEILLFAGLKDAAGRSRLEIEIPDISSTQDLRATILEREPRLRNLHFSIAINRRIGADALPVRAGDEIACIPPVSGG